MNQDELAWVSEQIRNEHSNEVLEVWRQAIIARIEELKDAEAPQARKAPRTESLVPGIPADHSAICGCHTCIIDRLKKQDERKHKHNG
jgi:hypothetical protein